MRRSVLFAVALLVGSAVAAWPGAARAAIPYVLDPHSDYETGCFGPCACPVLIQEPMKGTFQLTDAGAGPLYHDYDVTDIDWKVPLRDRTLEITGAGKYQVGGEVAVSQRLMLDLMLGGEGPYHFDSGLVQGGGTFPHIDVTVSLHQNAQCLDTVLDVVASPANADALSHSSVSSLRARPNPFSGTVDLELTLVQDAAVRAVVLDDQGRIVRRLLAGSRLAAGETRLTWDGRNDRGASLGPAVYYVRVSAADRVWRERLVKLR